MSVARDTSTDDLLLIHPVRHTTPCKECPFRRAAPAGWLGGPPVEDYMGCIRMDVPISCHLTREKKKEPAMCAGSLIHIKNQLKVPRDQGLYDAVKRVSESAAVFQWPHEFEHHHKHGLLAQVAAIRARRKKK